MYHSSLYHAMENTQANTINVMNMQISFEKKINWIHIVHNLIIDFII